MTTLKQIYQSECSKLEVKANSALVHNLPDGAKGFTNLDLNNNMVGTRGLDAVLILVENHLKDLKTLNLSGNNLTSPATKSLLQHLQKHPALQSIDLSKNDLRLGGPELVELLKRNRHITSMNVEDTFLRPLFVRLIDIQLKKNSGAAPSPMQQQQQQISSTGAPTINAPPASQSQNPFAQPGKEKGSPSGRRAQFAAFDEPPKHADEKAPASEDAGRFAFGAPDPESDNATKEAEESAFAAFQNVTFGGGTESGGKAKPIVPRRPTVCSEVYKEDEIDNFQPEVYEKEPKVSQWLMATLERNHLFSHLEDFELQVAVNAMTESQRSEGDTIYEEGDDADMFYIIGSGEVKCVNKKGEETVFKKGGALQELRLLYPGTSSETATCLGEVTVYTLDRQTYKCVLRKASKKKRALYEGFLSTVGFLKAANLTKQELLQLADALKPFQCEAGGTLIKYGEVGLKFFLIVEGIVEVFGRDDSNNTIKVCEFTVGDCIGELEFLNNHKCVADCKAKTFLRAAIMDRHHFEMVMGPVKEVLARNASESTVFEYYRHQLEKMEKDGGSKDAAH